MPLNLTTKENTMQVRRQRPSTHSSVWIDPAVSSTFSLIVDAPTRPFPRKLTTRVRRSTIDEIDTLLPESQKLSALQIDDLPTRPPASRQPSLCSIDDLPTMPPPPQQRSTAHNSPARPQSPHPLPSYIARDVAHPAYTRLDTERKVSKDMARQYKLDSLLLASGKSPFRNPVDRLRWWLLKPGHLELVVWITGTILLMIITLSFLFVIAFSLAWITPGQHLITPSNISAPATINSTNSQHLPIHSTP
jgi:hypothetical protein